MRLIRAVVTAIMESQVFRGTVERNRQEITNSHDEKVLPMPFLEAVNKRKNSYSNKELMRTQQRHVVAQLMHVFKSSEATNEVFQAKQKEKPHVCEAYKSKNLAFLWELGVLSGHKDMGQLRDYWTAGVPTVGPVSPSGVFERVSPEKNPFWECDKLPEEPPPVNPKKLPKEPLSFMSEHNNVRMWQESKEIRENLLTEISEDQLIFQPLIAFGTIVSLIG